MKTEDEWFAEHPFLDRDWWLSLDHGAMCSRYWEPDQDQDAPAYQTCRSMHCPRCGRATGGQGHLTCPA